MPGPYWALMTHPRSTPALMVRAFGEVHMLSHLAGATNRADIRRLRKDRKNNPSIDIVVRVSVWSLSGSMSVRGQTYRGRGDAIWSRRS